MLAALCSGVRKNQLVALDLADVHESDGVLTLSIRRLGETSRAQQRMILLSVESGALLRRYWVHERLSQQPADALLFWTLGRHDRCRRTRITGHAVNYWLERLRKRAGLGQRLTSRALRRPAPASCRFPPGLTFLRVYAELRRARRCLSARCCIVIGWGPRVVSCSPMTILRCNVPCSAFPRSSGMRCCR